jgi:hypothetical protein
MRVKYFRVLRRNLFIMKGDLVFDLRFGKKLGFAFILVILELSSFRDGSFFILGQIFLFRTTNLDQG